MFFTSLGEHSTFIFTSGKKGPTILAENKENKRELLEILKRSEYYISRRKLALEGKDTREFIEELERFTASLWRALYDLNQKFSELKEKIGETENKSTKLEEFLISQLFNNVTDGITN
jgi:predicted nuclease with TOPRIM domain